MNLLNGTRYFDCESENSAYLDVFHSPFRFTVGEGGNGSFDDETSNSPVRNMSESGLSSNNNNNNNNNFNSNTLQKGKKGIFKKVVYLFSFCFLKVDFC